MKSGSNIVCLAHHKGNFNRGCKIPCMTVSRTSAETSYLHDVSTAINTLITRYNRCNYGIDANGQNGIFVIDHPRGSWLLVYYGHN